MQSRSIIHYDCSNPNKQQQQQQVLQELLSLREQSIAALSLEVDDLEEESDLSKRRLQVILLFPR